MYTINLGIEWLITLLVVVNIGAVFLIRSHDRFWLPPVTVWIFLFFAWITISQTNKRIIEYNQIAVEEHMQSSGPFNRYEVDESKKQSRSTDHTFITLLGIQSIIGLLLQLAGLRSTGRKYYRTSVYTFLFLSVCYLVTVVFFYVV